MGKLVDLSSMQFGDWKVIDYAGKSYWNCVCTNCGTKKKVLASNLRNGNSASCGCHHNRDLVGQVFGRLTVIKLHHKSDKNYWHEIVIFCAKC